MAKKTKLPTGKQMGRPAIEIPIDVLDTACQFNANMNQILMILEGKGIKVTDDTVNNFCKRKFGITFSEYKDKRFENTKLMLVQKTIKMALEGNATMMIFTLKNVCKWTDKVEVTPKEAKRELASASDEELDELL